MTVLACPILVLLLDDTVVCVSREFLFLVFFLRIGVLDLARGAGLGSADPIAVAFALVLVTAGSAGFVRDLVLRAGAVGLTVILAADFCFLILLSPLMMSSALLLYGASVGVAPSELPT